MVHLQCRHANALLSDSLDSKCFACIDIQAFDSGSDQEGVDRLITFGFTVYSDQVPFHLAAFRLPFQYHSFLATVLWGFQTYVRFLLR